MEKPDLERLKIVYRDPKALVAYDKNSRTHTPEQIEALRRSIREFGFTNPVLLKDDDATIGAGHARCEAALAEGIDSIPTITLPGLDEAKWRAYVIADNQLAINGSGWDFDTLASEMDWLKDSNFDLSLLGFDGDDLSELLGLGGDDNSSEPKRTGGLSEEFLIPPFSVFNAREGWWQDRKRQWIALGIKSEVGRGENLLQFSESAQIGGMDKKNKNSAIPGGHTGKNSAWLFKRKDGSMKSNKEIGE